MCGIFAISLSPSSHMPASKLSHNLLKNLEPRGTDASGIAYQTGDRTFFIKRDLPGRFLDLSPLPRATRTIVGHTRNSTKGDPSVNDNNHPILSPSGTIALVHNGVISNDASIRVDFPGLPEVDSAVLPAMIEANGWEFAMENASGWAAVAWLDTVQQNTVHLVRRDASSPMELAYMRDGSIIMASTERAISSSLEAIGYLDEVESMYSVPTATFLSIKRGRVSAMSSSPTYSYQSAKYKSNAMSSADRSRLEATTSGRSTSSYSPPKSNPKAVGSEVVGRPKGLQPLAGGTGAPSGGNTKRTHCPGCGRAYAANLTHVCPKGAMFDEPPGDEDTPLWASEGWFGQPETEDIGFLDAMSPGEVASMLEDSLTEGDRDLLRKVALFLTTQTMHGASQRHFISLRSYVEGKYAATKSSSLLSSGFVQFGVAEDHPERYVAFTRGLDVWDEVGEVLEFLERTQLAERK